MRIAALALTLSILLAMGFAVPPPSSADCASSHIATVATAIQNGVLTIADGHGFIDIDQGSSTSTIALVSSGEITTTTIIPTASPPALRAPRALLTNSTTREEAIQAHAAYIGDAVNSGVDSRHLDEIVIKTGHPLRR